MTNPSSTLLEFFAMRSVVVTDQRTTQEEPWIPVEARKIDAFRCAESTGFDLVAPSL
jgi:hypothetical protein